MVVQNLYKGGTIIGQAKDLPTLYLPELAHDVAVKVINHVAQRRSISKLVDSVAARVASTSTRPLRRVWRLISL
jgi:hypothetical protein